MSITTERIIIEELKKISPQLIEDIAEVSAHLYGTSSKKVCQKWLRLLLDYPNSHFFIAKLPQSNKIIGMLTLVSYPTIGGYQKTWIEDVVVSPEARGKGAGKELVKKALQKAKQLKAKEVNLTSNPKRVIANKMYQKLQFSQYDTNYYRYKFDK